MVFYTEQEISNKWYALDPKTYKILGWSRKLATLQKRFPDGMNVIYSKTRIYTAEEYDKRHKNK